ncbi:MAG: hypothetical protein GYA24_24965, partial [Candidatus Lokiarchaeota archaeon]|nr:hypothetical protein [Candidatus Lokiarchaeota archaeon]
MNCDGHLDIVANVQCAFSGIASRSVVYVYYYAYNLNLAPSYYAWYDATQSLGYHTAYWNDMKIQAINYDTYPEIVLGGYVRFNTTEQRTATIMALNFISPTEFNIAALDYLEDSNRVMYTNDFSSYVTGTNPSWKDGWTSSNSIRSETIIKKNFGDHFDVLRINDLDPSGNAYITNTFTPDNRLLVQFDIAYESPLYMFYMDFFTAGNFKFYAWIYNGILNLYDPVTYQNKQVHQLDARKWYTIGFDYDWSLAPNGKFRVLVNGHDTSGWINCYNTGTALLDKIAFDTGWGDAGSNNTFYIDNFTISKPKGFEKSEISALDCNDVNQDGSIDIVATVNRHSITTGNYSTQVVLTKYMRNTAKAEETFESYPAGVPIDKLGYWRSVNGAGCSSTTYSDASGKSLQIFDSSTTAQAQAWWELPGIVPTQGSIKFTASTTNAARGTFFWLLDGISDQTSVPGVSPTGNARLQIYGNSWYVVDGGTFTVIQTCTSGVSYNVEIAYKIGVGFHVLINGVKYTRAGNASDYSFRFEGTPQKFDHFEVQTRISDISGSFSTRVDNIDVSWDVMYLGNNQANNWNFVGNVNLQGDAGITGQALVLKRNAGAQQADITQKTSAMSYNFHENAGGTISFWAKTVVDVPANFQLCDLYQSPAAGNPSFFRLFVDGANRIKKNWTDSGSQDSGAIWTSNVWHFIKIDFVIKGPAFDSWINVSYDGSMIFTNTRCEYQYASVNNVTFSLSENFAGHLLIDDFQLALKSQRIMHDCDWRESTPMISAGNLLSTWMNDISSGNEDSDGNVEIQIAGAYSNQGKDIGYYANLVFRSDAFVFESRGHATNQSTTAQYARILIGNERSMGARFLFVGGNYFYTSNGKTYYFLNLFLLSPRKADRSALVMDTGSSNALDLAALPSARNYAAVDCVDIDMDGKMEIIAVGNDQTAGRPMIIDVFRRTAPGYSQVYRQTIPVPLVGWTGVVVNAMLIKDIDNDNMPELMISGAIANSTSSVHAFTCILQYNTARKWPSQPYFTNNTIGNSLPSSALLPPFQFKEGTNPKHSVFTTISARDFNYDGIDEIVTGGYYNRSAGVEAPGWCIWRFNSTTRLFEKAYEYIYYTSNPSIRGRVTTSAIYDANYNGAFEVVLGGYATYYSPSNGPNFNADMRIWEVSKTLGLTFRRMATWYLVQSPAYGLLGMAPTYDSYRNTTLNGLVIADVNMDGVMEICTVGMMHYLVGNPRYGITSVYTFDGATIFKLVSYTYFSDSKSTFNTIHLAVDVGNIDYDDLSELVIGGRTVELSSSTNRHDLLTTLNPLVNGTYNYNTAEASMALFPNDEAAVTSVRVADSDNDGALEVISLIRDNTIGWRINIANKTRIIDKAPPELTLFSDAMNIVGGNVTLFHDNFDTNTIRWESMSGLWHVTGYWSTWPSSYRSYGQSIWFGSEATGNFYTASRARGSIVSMPIDLSGATSANLEFYHWRAGEGGTVYDQSYVYVSTNKVTWTKIYQDGNATVSPWQRKVLNLNAFCGSSTVWLNFTFDSIDGAMNNYRGWLVDDVKVYTNVQTVDLG